MVTTPSCVPYAIVDTGMFFARASWAAVEFGMPRVVFPEMAERTFGDPRGGGLALGLLFAAIPIGMVVAGLFSGWLHRIRSQGVAVTVAICVWGTSVALFGLSHSLWLAVLWLAVAGAGDLVSAVLRTSMLQTAAPDDMRGRMQGVFIAVVAGGPRLGDLRAGGTAAATSTTFSWVGGGLACMAVVAVAGVLVRPFWRYDTRVAHEPALGSQHGDDRAAVADGHYRTGQEGRLWCR